MENNKEVIEVLNDLIQINNDRVVGYERALKELKDDSSDLKTLFEVILTRAEISEML